MTSAEEEVVVADGLDHDLAVRPNSSRESDDRLQTSYTINCDRNINGKYDQIADNICPKQKESLRVRVKSSRTSSKSALKLTFPQPPGQKTTSFLNPLNKRINYR